MAKHHRSKSKNQTFHFKKRCNERLGVQINRKAIQRRIQNKSFDENFYFLDRQSNRVTRYKYKFNNKWYIIPYDKNTHKVITIFEDKKQDIQEQKVVLEVQVKKDFTYYFAKVLKYIVNIVCKKL